MIQVCGIDSCEEFGEVSVETTVWFDYAVAPVIMPFGICLAPNRGRAPPRHQTAATKTKSRGTILGSLSSAIATRERR